MSTLFKKWETVKFWKLSDNVWDFKHLHVRGHCHCVFVENAHFYTDPWNLKSQQNRIELVTRPGIDTLRPYTSESFMSIPDFPPTSHLRSTLNTRSSELTTTTVASTTSLWTKAGTIPTLIRVREHPAPEEGVVGHQDTTKMTKVGIISHISYRGVWMSGLKCKSKKLQNLQTSIILVTAIAYNA